MASQHIPQGTAPKNILVRMPNWLGDLVMATPVLADLRNHWKDAKITAMCQSNVAALLKHDPHVDEVLSFKKPNGWLHRQEHWAIIDPLRRGEFDLGILMTNSFSSAWWFWRGHVKNRIGFANNFRSWMLNAAVPFPRNMEKQHLVITYKQLLEPLEIPVSNTPPRLYISPEESQAAAELLSKVGVRIGEQTIVGVNPGAAYGSAKCWIPERFAEVTEKLLQDPKVVVLYFGDNNGAALVNSICQKFTDRVVNLAGKTTIRELMALIQKCNAFLTNDSGPMHIAAALGTPLVALFGSTNPYKTGPYGSGKIQVLYKEVECSPCYKRTCPIDFRCMKQIGTDEVYQGLQELLNGNLVKLGPSICSK